MNTIKISIIMPAYNGGKYIQETMDTLLAQVTPVVEVIVIDDGSQDNTLETLHQNYEPFISSQRLRIYSQANQGVSAARNYGLELAQGEFIGFMDADDLALPGYIATLLNAISPKIDIVEFGFKTFTDTMSETYTRPALYSNDQFGQHAVLTVIDKVYSTARWYPWSRLFRASLFQGVRFPVGIKFCEDLMTIPQLYEQAKTILVLLDVIYGYRINPMGATLNIRAEYINKLENFYFTIPKSNQIRHDYLRISIAYAIYSCQTKATGDWNMPPIIQKDLNRLRYRPSFYLNIELRRIAILFYPLAFRVLKQLRS